MGRHAPRLGMELGSVLGAHPHPFIPPSAHPPRHPILLVSPPRPQSHGCPQDSWVLSPAPPQPQPCGYPKDTWVPSLALIPQLQLPPQPHGCH